MPATERMQGSSVTIAAMGRSYSNLSVCTTLDSVAINGHGVCVMNPAIRRSRSH